MVSARLQERLAWNNKKSQENVYPEAIINLELLLMYLKSAITLYRIPQSSPLEFLIDRSLHTLPSNPFKLSSFTIDQRYQVLQCLTSVAL